MVIHGGRHCHAKRHERETAPSWNIYYPQNLLITSWTTFSPQAAASKGWALLAIE